MQTHLLAQCRNSDHGLGMRRWGLIAFLCLWSCRSDAEHEYQGLRGARFADSRGALVYRYHVPPQAGPEHRLPLVLYLHDEGRAGRDNERQVDFRVTRWLAHPCFVLAPQLPRGSWVAAKLAKGSYTFEEDKLTEPLQLVIELLELFLKRYPIDVSRIYVVGTSAGGFGAYELLMRKPHWFAAAVAIEGGGDPKQVTRFANIPLWAFHGVKDSKVPVAATRELIQALKAIGASPKYTEYPDTAWQRAFTPELDAWLFEQHR
jgi:predicted peptidase